MGCMHSWVWGETYPGFSDALMPLACLPVQIAGRNRMMRKMAMDGITGDPAWKSGDYTTQPPGLKTALEMLLIMGSSPLQMQEHEPTRDEADAYLEKFLDSHLRRRMRMIFFMRSTHRNYDLRRNGDDHGTVMAVNSADDFINPPELNIMPGMIKRVPRGKYVLLPITEQTRGHGTHNDGGDLAGLSGGAAAGVGEIRAGLGWPSGSSSAD